MFTVPGNVAIMGAGKKVTEPMTHIHRAARIWTWCALSKPDLTSSHRRTVTVHDPSSLTYSSVNGSHHLNTSQVVFWINHEVSPLHCIKYVGGD